MKTLFKILIVVIFLSAISVYAQKADRSKGDRNKNETNALKGGLTPEQRAEKQTKNFTEKLQLTEAQIPKVKQVLLERAQTAEKDKERCKGDGHCMQTARRDRNAVAERQLKQILTPEQYAKLQEIRKQARDKKRKEFEKQQGKRNVEDMEDELTEAEFLSE